jgi:triosephosphate isomerase
MRKKVVVGNWKMNKTLMQGVQLMDEIIESESSNDVLKIIAVPFTHLVTFADKLKSKNNYSVAAQNCHQEQSGAFTGEVSAEMISLAGANYVIVGHSERRIMFNETSAVLAQKVSIAIANNLIPIFCLGESNEDREQNKHLETVKQQLKDGVLHLQPDTFRKVMIAYEPVWAIGTGQNATTHQAQGMHNFIRQEINKKYGKAIADETIILYGGSCNADNAKELFACMDVDGGLVGGASLKAKDFNTIVNSF